jgi:hypothetical protein
MANIDAANGFTPLRHLTGGVVRPQQYIIANGTTANLASGDLVALSNSGVVVRASAGGIALGVFYGAEYIENSTGDVKFVKVWNNGTTVKANTTVKAYVYDDPNITYKVQGNGTFAAANVGETCNVTLGTFNSTFGYSTDEADLATLGVGAQVLKILRLVDEPNNTVGADAKLEVIINNSNYGTRTAGI